MVDFTEQRKHMIDNHLRPCGVTDPRILNIVHQIHRENFLPSPLKAMAYKDGAIVLDDGKFMLRPNDLLRMILALQIQKHENVLDVGCTSGYSTILMSFMCNQATGLDDNAQYIDQAEKLAAIEGVSNINFVAELTEPFLATDKKYPAILIQYAYDELPSYFFEALNEGGRLIYIQQQSKTYGQVVLVRNIGGQKNQMPLFELCAPRVNQPTPKGFIF